MKCCHREHKNEVWTLDLGDDAAEIRDAGGNVRAQFTRDQAAGQFLLPSFSESIKQFRAPIEGELWYFDVARGDLKQIKTYIDQAVVASGPEAMRTVRNHALRDMLIGIGAFGIGTFLTVGSYLHAAQNPEGGEYFISYGAVLFGLIMIGKGVYGLIRYRQLQKLSQTPPAG
ncbi:MAG TPA: hypothetical protein VH592_08540 [Gemmataceae bacterium]|jgi:hypothetical protein